ncbi:uncharacterized protein LOC144052475 [Vanacampus margaritifer]
MVSTEAQPDEDTAITDCAKVDQVSTDAQPEDIAVTDQVDQMPGHLVRMPPGRLPGEVFRACPTGRRPRGRPRTRWRDYVSRLSWERLGVPSDELAEVAGEREVWASLLKLLPPRPDPG